MGVSNKYGGDLMMTVFQSPQWRDCSKAENAPIIENMIAFQSP